MARIPTSAAAQNQQHGFHYNTLTHTHTHTLTDAYTTIHTRLALANTKSHIHI